MSTEPEPGPELLGSVLTRVAHQLAQARTTTDQHVDQQRPEREEQPR